MRKGSVLAIGLLSVSSWLAMPVARAATTNEQANMIGSEEVPGPGDPDGKGIAKITLDDVANTVCWNITYTLIDKPTAAHIHTGPRGVAGPPTVTLDIVKGNTGCVGVDPTVIAQIRDNPAGYYVNVHTANYPKGAIRGQLAKV